MKAFISSLLRPTRRHLTPEMVLYLASRGTPLWNAREGELPFEDPYWAFYWPGGQAVARYILDNKSQLYNRKVLDVGCGCGAGSIAAAKMGAKRVVANDIDTNALIATKLNAELNKVLIETSEKDFIGSKCDDFDVILIGDMFYDEEFAKTLFRWLQGLTDCGKTVLIGDPGRHGLTDRRRQSMELLAKYKMPEDSCLENNGFQETTVWRLNK